MAASYLSPGVYVEEVDRGSKPIEAVGTNTVGFLGESMMGPVNQAVLIVNWSQFVKTFGDFTQSTHLAHAIYGFFNNGGSRCFVVNVGAPASLDIEPVGGAAAAPAKEGEKKPEAKPAENSPNPATFVDGVDFGTMQYSGSGDVTGSLYAVDLVVPPVGAANGNTSGCEAADFAGFPAGAIALLQRGTCTFRSKADNAAAAGASAVVIFNEGQPGRTAGAFGTLGPPLHPLPVLSASFALGDALRNGQLNGATGVTVHIKTDTVAEIRTAYNVLAETPGGDPNHAIVIGAHLDSVSRGPGINDNGSGSAAILEIAEIFAAQVRETRNKLRFAWWGAEEEGLLGSTFYVNSLSQAEKDQIELNLNFDMIGSPNFVRFVYDGNNSAGGGAVGPAGSGAIEQVFLDYFASQGLATAPTPFNGRSDYGPFIAAGIPAGGLFTGAEGIKTPAQAAIYGGAAGEQYDPCYHLACDTYQNNNNTALDQMSDAVAHTVLLFSKRDFAKNPLIDPVATSSSSTGGGGGLYDDHDRVDR
jgi:Zn-dependent M28 family amino/carboxypeptidase